MLAPTNLYWVAVKCIIRYLKGTTFFGLHITRSSSFSLHGFIDANWASSINDHKSMGEYLVFSFFFYIHRFLGSQENNALLLGLLPRLSIKPELMALLASIFIVRSVDYSFFSAVYFFLQNLSFILVLSMLKLIIILSVKKLLQKPSKFVLFLPRICLQMFLQNLSPLLIYITNKIWLTKSIFI